MSVEKCEFPGCSEQIGGTSHRPVLLSNFLTYKSGSRFQKSVPK